MSKKVVVTLTRVYSKTVKVEVDSKLVEGMSDEEVATHLIEEYNIEDEDAAFDGVEFMGEDFDEDSLNNVDSDRYDIYKDGKQVYGGHL